MSEEFFLIGAPWTVEEHGAGSHVKDVMGCLVAMHCAPPDAQLIAVAPRLYTLLEDIEKTLTDDGTYSHLRKACRDILREARGDA